MLPGLFCKKTALLFLTAVLAIFACGSAVAAGAFLANDYTSGLGNAGPFFKVSISALSVSPAEVGKAAAISAVISHDFNSPMDFLAEVKVEKTGKAEFSASEVISGVKSGEKKKMAFREKWAPQLPGEYTATLKIFSKDRAISYYSQKISVKVTENIDIYKEKILPEASQGKGGNVSGESVAADDKNAGQQEKKGRLSLGFDVPATAVVAAGIIALAIIFAYLVVSLRS